MQRLAILLSVASWGLVACGSAGPTRISSGPTSAAVTRPAPPPPPPPARLRLINASPDPLAAHVSIYLDGRDRPAATVASQAGSTWIELDPGVHPISLRGEPPTEDAEGPEIAAGETPELHSGHGTTLILWGLINASPLLAITIAEEQPPSSLAAARFFYGLLSAPAVDLCIAGAGPSDPGIPLFAQVQPGSLARSESGSEYVEWIAGNELVLQLRQANRSACRGRVIGVARLTPTEGRAVTLVAAGRMSGGGRRRVGPALLVCSDAPDDGSCVSLPITPR